MYSYNNITTINGLKHILDEIFSINPRRQINKINQKSREIPALLENQFTRLESQNLERTTDYVSQ